MEQKNITKEGVEVKRNPIRCDYPGWDELDDREEDDDRQLLGYVCLSCGHSQAGPGFGLQCDRCCGPLDEWYD